MAKSVTAIVETEDLVTREIFGDGVRAEIIKAKNVLNDFASFLPKLREVQAEIEAELDACTKKGQASNIMKRVRWQYL